ncbi:MAG: hypothetical protein SVR08_06870 [Spirochaetota bacterium]|nr:hypothetical protein [Spirochaetota bacterium]
MKASKIKKVYLFFLASILIFPSLANSQEKKADEEAIKRDPSLAYTEAERPEDNYLARFTGIRVSEKLIKENLENIYMLKVIVSNFKQQQDWGEEYKKIYASYKKGVGLFYRRNVIYARVELEKNKRDITQLCKKIFTVYRKQSIEMLDECSDKILNFSLDESTKFDPNKNRILFKNMMRLWIAYGQIDDADDSAIDNLFKSSIFHVRIAKSYAIKILEQLDPKKSEGRFNVHKADNRNRILNPETTTSAKSEPEKKAPGKPGVK